MFEQVPAQMIATIFIEDRDARLANENGIPVSAGPQVMSFNEALEVIVKMDKALAGVVYKRYQKRFKATRNQIMFAFGPEMEQAVADKVNDHNPL